MPIRYMLEEIKRFNQEIVEYPIPEHPERLPDFRKQFALECLREEINEFDYAKNLEDEVDALVDLTYFALGRIIEMGMTPAALFGEVHAANMKKIQGKLDKRPSSAGYDAVKPPDWRPPDFMPYLSVSRSEILAAVWQPKILVIGHAGHGKDTVCEMLRDNYGFRFKSTSQIAAESIIFPQWGNKHYGNWLACFNDRQNHREKWYQIIKEFNASNAAAFARKVLDLDCDIYCGMRSADELLTCQSKNMFDVILWVDRSLYEEIESVHSCTVTKDMADYIIDNNGSLRNLEENLYKILKNIYGAKLLSARVS